MRTILKQGAVTAVASFVATSTGSRKSCSSLLELLPSQHLRVRLRGHKVRAMPQLASRRWTTWSESHFSVAAVRLVGIGQRRIITALSRLDVERILERRRVAPRAVAGILGICFQSVRAAACSRHHPCSGRARGHFFCRAFEAALIEAGEKVAATPRRTRAVLRSCLHDAGHDDVEHVHVEPLNILQLDLQGSELEPRHRVFGRFDGCFQRRDVWHLHDRLE
mmetsp:Transcript_17550/g.43791  ORF Transcript_17550/g.43791 Transcript_17550/m.43791 type:complete len:222 (+) Transcript_17550:3966-4631(+)